MTPLALVAALLTAFGLIFAAVARLLWRHSGAVPRHRLYRPDLRRSRLRPLIRRDLP